MTSETQTDLVVFDLDGTLVELDFTGEGMETVRSDLQEVFEPVGIEREFKPLLTELDEALTELRGTEAKDVFERVSQAAFDAITEMERDAASRLDVYESALTVYEEAVESGATVAIATNNTRGAAEMAIADAGLSEPDLLVALDDVGRPKPNADMLETVLKRSTVTQSKMVMIGDRRSDAVSALRACEGREVTPFTVLIDTDESEEPDDTIDHVVSSVSGVLSVLTLPSAD
jgi:phosphoglycolate phosphatase-like HAD superfamily hydrolase